MRLLERLHKGILVLMMIGDVVLTAHEDGFIEPLVLAGSLWMIHCCGHVFKTEEGAHSSKKTANEFSIIGRENVIGIP